MVEDLSEEVRSDVARRRMIMTFKESVFNRPRLEERLKDLIHQDIFRPDCLIIDGYDFDGNGRKAMEDLKALMADLGIAVICHTIDDLFEVVLLIKPHGEAIHLDILRCAYCQVEPGTTLTLDPSTMMINKR
jgi:hypothetical protein